MSSIYFIRHGQASFGADNYDVLSELGAEQSRALGRFVANSDIELDAVYVGPRERQKDTARHMREAAAQAGKPLPEPTFLRGLDEYPALELFKRWLPRLAELDPSFKGMMNGSPESQRREAQDAFELISFKWASGDLVDDDLETFQQFTDRVVGCIDHIRSEQGRGKRVAVVTSGGPVSIAMKLALTLNSDITLKVSWVVANASISEFRYRQDSFNLVGFNRVAHLTPSRLLTYR